MARPNESIELEPKALTDALDVDCSKISQIHP